MKNNRYTLRALARLLAYPDAQLRSELSALADAIDQEAALPAARRAELRTLALELQRSAPLDTEARYVETFDRGRAPRCTCSSMYTATRATVAPP